MASQPAERTHGVDESILAHYESSPRQEDARLRGGIGEIEQLRTQEILRRYLGDGAPRRVLDVGGGPGVHAEWLAADGHRVHLVDPVPLHVAQAAARGRAASTPFTASFGDARELAARDEWFDAVLLLGPLYHLVERADRDRALAEARRVLRPGGLLFAAAISRFASLLDGAAHGWLVDPEFAAVVAGDLATGVHQNPTGRDGWFTTAYFHRPDELATEARAAGFVVDATLAVEGPAYWTVRRAAGRDGDLADDDRRQVLDVARRCEQEPSVLGASPHLMLVAGRP